MKNQTQEGNVVTLIAPAAITAGTCINNGVLAGVAITDAANGAAVECATTGVYSLAKTSAQAWTLGQAIYLIPSTRLTTTATTTGNLLIGAAAAVAANPSATGLVRLNGSAPAAVTP
jgi:predicted RecA/RadA family phage recombinase